MSQVYTIYVTPRLWKCGAESVAGIYNVGMTPGLLEMCCRKFKLRFFEIEKFLDTFLPI